MRYHFIGIKGSGMSALAIVLKGLGHKVKGSDYSTYIFDLQYSLIDQILQQFFQFVNGENKNMYFFAKKTRTYFSDSVFFN